MKKCIILEIYSNRSKGKEMKRLNGCRRPHLLTDRIQFRTDTTTPPVEYLWQVSKQSNKWSRRRCDNEIVTVLSKGQITILKMAAFRPYLLTDQNYFQADTDIERNLYASFRQHSSSGFGGDAITVKINDRWWRTYLSTDQNHVRADTTRSLAEYLRQV